jgi:hypothetical protein
MRINYSLIFASDVLISGMEVLIATQCGGFRQTFPQPCCQRTTVDALLQVVILLRRRHSGLSISGTSGQVCLYTSKRLLLLVCLLLEALDLNRISRIWDEG